MIPDDVTHMSDSVLLDMHYFLTEDAFDDDNCKSVENAFTYLNSFFALQYITSHLTYPLEYIL